MVDSHMHRRFGLFGTERTGAGIIKCGRFDRFSPVAGFGGSRSGTSEVVAGAGPVQATVPAVFAFSDPRAGRGESITKVANDSPTQVIRPSWSASSTNSVAVAGFSGAFGRPRIVASRWSVAGRLIGPPALKTRWRWSEGT